MKLEHSAYKILEISLTDKTHLSTLFDKSNYKKAKEHMIQVSRIYLIFNLVYF